MATKNVPKITLNCLMDKFFQDNPNLILKTPCCNTSTYQASYFNRIVKLWNCVCSSATPDTFSCLRTLLICFVFDVNLLCTWSMSRECPCVLCFLYCNLLFFLYFAKLVLLLVRNIDTVLSCIRRGASHWYFFSRSHLHYLG